MDMKNCEDIYFKTSTLLTWMQYDILQLPAPNQSIRSELFDLPLLFGTLTMSEKGEENELQKISCRVYG
jgi:hypothetical protein